MLIDLGVLTQEGGSQRNHIISNLGVSNLSERFLSDLVLTHGAREDVNVEPYLFDLGVPTQKGGSLRNHIIPSLGVSNPSERFFTDLILVVRSQGTGLNC